MVAVVTRYGMETSRRKIRKHNADDASHAEFESVVLSSGCQQFPVNTFNVILDKLLSALNYVLRHMPCLIIALDLSTTSMTKPETSNVSI